MLVKVLTGLVLLGALAWMLAPRRTSTKVGRGGAAPRVPQAHDLEKCPRCGIWLPAGQRCDCDKPG